jgi:hypothetical protein
VNPFTDASMSAVLPSFARLSTTAPLSISCRTSATSPLADAHISGVKPRRSAVFTSAPLARRSFVRLSCPSCADSRSSASDLA